MNGKPHGRGGLLPYLLWAALFVAAPIALIVYFSLLDADGRFTLENYRNFFRPSYLWMTLNSFWYAFLITVCTLVVAYPAAWIITKTKHKHLWLMLIIIPSWINLLLKTYAFIGILGLHGPVNAFLSLFGAEPTQILFTDFSFILVAVYIFIPFMILPIYNSLDQLDRNLVYAARDLGASGWETFRRVVLPLTLDGVKSGIQVTFIPALSLFMITRLIAGNKVVTLGTAIEQQFLVAQNWGMGSTVALILILLMVLSMFLTGAKRAGGRT